MVVLTYKKAVGLPYLPGCNNVGQGIFAQRQWPNDSLLSRRLDPILDTAFELWKT